MDQLTSLEKTQHNTTHTHTHYHTITLSHYHTHDQDGSFLGSSPGYSSVPSSAPTQIDSPYRNLLHLPTQVDLFSAATQIDSSPRHSDSEYGNAFGCWCVPALDYLLTCLSVCLWLQCTESMNSMPTQSDEIMPVDERNGKRNLL